MNNVKRPHRRDPAPIDPFKILAAEGEGALRAALQGLDIESLKNVIAEFDMDRDRLALKWRSADRLIDRIMQSVLSRSRKGDAFLNE